MAGASFNLSDVKATNGIIHIIDKVFVSGMFCLLCFFFLFVCVTGSNDGGEL